MWTPLPHEADLFCNVYIDESSQTDHRYFVLGGLVVPLSHTVQFETDIISARDDIIAIAKPDGTPRVIKWQKVNPYNVAAYRRVVDAFFAFVGNHNLPARKHVDINCRVVDTRENSLRDVGDGDAEIGFNKEMYFLCAPMIGKRFKEELFHVYQDRRNTRIPLEQAREIMNLGARKYGDKRLWPYRRLRFEDPEQCQALQVVDIFIGALAYRLNGHYDRPEANAAKKELCDYIFARSKITDPFKTTPYNLRRFAIMHRRSSPTTR